MGCVSKSIFDLFPKFFCIDASSSLERGQKKGGIIVTGFGGSGGGCLGSSDCRQRLYGTDLPFCVPDRKSVV